MARSYELAGKPQIRDARLVGSSTLQQILEPLTRAPYSGEKGSAPRALAIVQQLFHPVSMILQRAYLFRRLCTAAVFSG
jgi:hypothetical protein